MKGSQKDSEEGKIRYVFTIGKDEEGHTALLSTKQIFSKEQGRYITEVVEGKPTIKPVKLEEASELLASLIAEASW